MPTIEIRETGRLDERESAFPQATQLPNGDLVCSFSVGGAAHVSGGSDWARSTDGGRTWHLAGTVLPVDPEHGWANALKTSYDADSKTLYAYGSRIASDTQNAFGDRATTAIYCRSEDEGQTWSPASEVPFGVDCPLEVSHGILPLGEGRLLAPAATLPASDRLGEQVLVAISDDGGQSWPQTSIVLEDRQQQRVFFEQKLAQLGDGRVLATAWTATRPDYIDEPNSFAISSDRGTSWGPVQSTGIQGQTMTPIPLGDDRLLVVYNRRYGDQAIIMCLVTMTDDSWTVHYEGILYDAQTQHQRQASENWQTEELAAFQFGFPTAVILADGSVLATHWSVEEGRCGIRWTRLAIDWT